MTSPAEMKNKLLTVAAATLATIAPVSAPLAAPLAAPAPGIVGVDHIGINVPDLDQAVRFFHDMFGFDAVTRIGPFKLDANWRKNYHLHDTADEVTLVMLRAGDGANIELFGYTPASGNQVQPYRDDIGATHISLYTTDIDGTKAYLEAKGIKFLTDINSGGGDTEGERWVYFETPWGASIELNAYPNGKAYEKRQPPVKLWSAAAAVELSATSPSAAALQALAQQQAQIWNDADSQERMRRMQAIYKDNVSFFDPENALVGIAALNERIARLQRAHPGYVFRPAGIDGSGNMVRYRWSYGPPADPRRLSGMDLIVMDNGKIRSLNIFVDPVPGHAQP